MSKKTARKWKIAVGVVPLIYIAWVAIAPPSFDGLGEAVPDIDALNDYNRSGDGYTNLTEAHTGLYYMRPVVLADLKDDAGRPYLFINNRQRTAIDAEMRQRGFKATYDGRAASYERIIGWLFPIHSFVLVSKEGKVYVGAARHKWPPIG